MTPKPGNVSRGRDLPSLAFRDFVLSAQAIGHAFRSCARRSVGGLILHAVRETRRHVATNTNLGIVLLLAPLAHAAARPGRRSLRVRLRETLRALDRKDARDAYEAIRMAKPGGLGRTTAQDISERPSATLLECMRLGSDRDAIAREYVTDFSTTFELAVPTLTRMRERHAPLPQAIVETYLTVLSGIPDTLITRKHGPREADAVSREASSILSDGGPATESGRRQLERFDERLRAARPPLNPGTTADLTAAALFVWILESGPGPQRPKTGSTRRGSTHAPSAGRLGVPRRKRRRSTAAPPSRRRRARKRPAPRNSAPRRRPRRS